MILQKRLLTKSVRTDLGHNKHVAKLAKLTNLANLHRIELPLPYPICHTPRPQFTKLTAKPSRTATPVREK
jgi:hypothetical protein